MVAAATVPGIHQSGIHSARPAATAVAAGALYACSTHGLIYYSDGATWTTWIPASLATGGVLAIPFIIDGGGSAITTGIKGDIEIPFAATVTAVRLFADASGSIVVDIWKDTYANYPPTNADSICASAKPTLASSLKSQDSTLTGWTTAVAAGDILRFNVDSAATVTRVLLSLTLVRA